MAENDQTPSQTAGREDDVTLTKTRGISLVWIIPIVAAVVAGWLVYTTLSEKGPTVTITFKTAEGLEAGQTKNGLTGTRAFPGKGLDLEFDVFEFRLLLFQIVVDPATFAPPKLIAVE